MSLDTYRQLQGSDELAAHHYFNTHFDLLFAEAVGQFSAIGWVAIGMAAVMVMVAWGSWVGLRRRLPLVWLWLVPLLGFTLYASIKSIVVYELIQRAPELPQMWALYFKSWTPLSMVRTSMFGLLFTTAALWLAAYWGRRKVTGR